MIKKLTYEETEHLISVQDLKKKYNLNAKDEVIQSILLIAVKNIELEYGIDLIYKIWKLQHDNEHINLSGPVVNIFSIKNEKNETIKPKAINRNNDNIMLTVDRDLGMVTVVYSTGYNDENLPICLKNCVEEEFLSLYYEQLNDKIEIDYESENKKIHKYTNKYFISNIRRDACKRIII